MRAVAGGWTGRRRSGTAVSRVVLTLTAIVGATLGCGGRSGFSLPLDSDGRSGGFTAAGGNGTTVGGGLAIGGAPVKPPGSSMPANELPNWERIPAAGPRRRWGGGLAYDDARQVVTLFSGWTDLKDNKNGNWPLSDTWEWDGRSWSLIADARVDGIPQPGAAPIAWILFGMTYDSKRRRVITHGGYTNGGPDNCGVVDQLLNASRATWQWDGTRWEPLTCDGPEAINVDLVYDTVRDRVVMVAGVPDPPEYRIGSKYGTWELDGNSWQRVGDAPPLLADGQALSDPGYAMAFDRGRGVTVLQVLGNTWEFDGSSWALKSTKGPPDGQVGQIGIRWGSEMAYDARRARIVLLAYDSTWEWDGQNWEQRTLAPAPSRASTHLAYDEARGQVMLFGGDHGDYGHGALGDTWIYQP